MNRDTNPTQMDLTARVAFARVYPAIARHVVEKYGITSGLCLDAGSGPASLALALARVTDLQIVSLDREPEMTSLAEKNIAGAGLAHRIVAVTADVCRIPFDDGYFDLVVSRGSVFFWDDRPAALRELYRVVKPGGVIYCGGGMGSEAIHREADEIIMSDERFKDMRDFWQQRKGRLGKENEAAFAEDLNRAGLEGRILKDGGGIWIEIIG